MLSVDCGVDLDYLAGDQGWAGGEQGGAPPARRLKYRGSCYTAITRVNFHQTLDLFVLTSPRTLPDPYLYIPANTTPMSALC